MKNRFGNVTYVSTLSQGLCPLVQDPDTLVHVGASFTFSFVEGYTVEDTLSTSLPSVLASSLTTVVAYITRDYEDTLSTSLPTVLGATLTSNVTYVNIDLDTDTLSTSLPTIQSAALTSVVRIHELFDAVLNRPEDTLASTPSWEFTLS